MTTQVVLMNGLGVALASDSAVTAGGKVLNTSEKLFEFPAPHKLAVLISGRAEFMGHPWEVLLSAWVEGLSRQFPTLLEYRDAFYKFLMGVFSSSPSLSRFESNYLKDCYFAEDGPYKTARTILSDLCIPFYESALSKEDFGIFMQNSDWPDGFREKLTSLLTEDLVAEIHKRFAEAMEYALSEYTPVDGVSNAQARIWVDKYYSQFEKPLPEVDFEYWPDVPNLENLVKDLFAARIIHADFSDANINFVGYGFGEIFPSAAGVYLHGAVGGFLLKRWEGNLTPSPEPRYFFCGQDDAIVSLTKGEDYLLTDRAVELAKRKLNDIYLQLAESTDERVQMTREYVKQSIDADDIKEELIRAGNDRKLKPFTKAIYMSPILDLAEFAAQLVGVQAASAAMTQENPTVGGFVDVAVITHRRGFEWIRHKH